MGKKGKFINSRKRYILKYDKYRIAATQLSIYAEEYSLTIRNTETGEEWIRAKTSPFEDMSGEMSFLVHSPIDKIIPLSKFECSEFYGL